MLILALIGPAAADCTESLTTVDLRGILDDARNALEQLDSASFQAATDDLQQQLPCVDEPIDRHLAAEIHRTHGIRAVGDRDPNAARMFAAARVLEPAYKFPSTLIPSGNPVRLEYASFNVSNGTFETMDTPAQGRIQLDGGTSIHRPMAWPTVAQFIGTDGGVRWTLYLGPEDEMPHYLVGEPVPDTPVSLLPDPIPFVPPPIPPAAKSARGPMLGAGVGGLVLSGALYGLAGIAEAQYKDPSTSDAQLDGLRARANGLSIASGFVGVASIGVGIAGIATPPAQ